jgi:hypothetical protein
VDGSFQWSDGAGDEHVAPPGDVARLAGDLRRLAIEATGAVGEAKGCEAETVGAERVGLDHVRAGVDVLAVDCPDQVRPRFDQLVERRSLGHSATE